jgi:hypothetical protein
VQILLRNSFGGQVASSWKIIVNRHRFIKPHKHGPRHEFLFAL